MLTSTASVAALLCGVWFYRMAAEVVRPWLGSREAANLCGFLMIFVAVILLGLVVNTSTWWRNSLLMK